MHPLSEDHKDIGESRNFSESDCSETPSELEARLYSVLHYNDLTQPLPPEIASEYAITISGSEVCISASNNPPSVNKVMAEDDKKPLPSEMASENTTEVCVSTKSNPTSDEKDLAENYNKASTSYHQGDLSTTEETEAVLNTRKNRLTADWENELPTYLSYVTWWERLDNTRLVRDIMRTLPCYLTGTNSYAACKNRVQKHVAGIRNIMRKLKEEEFQPDALKKAFSDFITAACIPRGIGESEAITEFVDELSPINATYFNRHCTNWTAELYPNISRKLSQQKNFVREVILKKFELFLDVNRSSDKIECVERFCDKTPYIRGELLLFNDTNLREQLFTLYENHSVYEKKKTNDGNDKHVSDPVDACNSSFDDPVPLKKRKLDDGKELKITQVPQGQTSSVDSKSELRSLLSKHNPGLGEEEILFKIFKEFHEFSMNEKLSSRKHKFVKVFAKYSRTARCFFSLYSGLIDESIFRSLFIYGKEHANKQNEPHSETMKKFIDSLVKEALPAKSLEQLNDTHSLVSSNKLNEPSSVLNKTNSNEDVIVLSGDESEGEIISSDPEENDISVVSSENVWINTNQIPSTSSENHPLPPSPDFPSFSGSFGESSTSNVGNYFSSCPPSWSKEMIKWYCKSWGGEAFDHADVLREFKATTKPSDWKITNYTDLIPPRKRKRSNQQCNRCLQWGHLQYQCKEPIKPIVCSICGEYDHKYTACRNTKCLRCGARRRKFVGSCDICKGPSKPLKCSLCESDTHVRDFCPDTWRSYHLTTRGDIVVPPELDMNPRQFCCNCGKAGHLDYFCPLLTSSNAFNVVNSPFVLNYNVENSSISDKSNSSEVSDNNASFIKTSNRTEVNDSRNSSSTRNSQEFPFKLSNKKSKRYWASPVGEAFPRGKKKKAPKKNKNQGASSKGDNHAYNILSAYFSGKKSRNKP